MGNEGLDFSCFPCFAKVIAHTWKTLSVKCFSNSEAARLSHKCINILSNTSDNNEKAANLR